MLSTGAGVFIQIPDGSNRRVLLPGTVLEVNDVSYTASLAEEQAILTPEAGQEALIYFEIKGRFMQQPTRIDAVMAADSSTIVGFTTIGEPISAESRRCPRLSIADTGLSAMIGPEESCPLVDISPAGFSIIASERYEVGKLIDVTLCYEDRLFSGAACVQSIRHLGDGRIRYGLQSVGDRRYGGTLQKGQQHISMDLQRCQLRELTGS